MSFNSGCHRWLAFALIAASSGAGAQMAKPGTAPARGPDAPREEVTQAPATDPDAGSAIVPDAAFDAALPSLSNDINAPLEPLPPIGDARAPAPVVLPGTMPPATAADPELDQPLQPLANTNTVPLQSAADVAENDRPQIRYELAVRGLKEIGLEDEFKSLSALEDGDGKATNATQVNARAKEDEQLAIRLMKSLGYYDGVASSTIETVGTEPVRQARFFPPAGSCVRVVTGG